MDHRGVAEYADLRLRTVLVAQTDGVADDLGKVGVTRGLAVACEGEHVGQLAFGHHLPELLLQFHDYLFPCGQG